MNNNYVNYRENSNIAVIQLDDGKRNALSPAMLKAIYAAIDRAEQDQAAIVFTGREDVFSAGFDLKVMKDGGTHAIRMLQLGYSLTARVLAYPYPVVTACNGHVLAMGVFLMLASDYVIGAQGDFKISANEVAIGLTMPRVAAAMLEHRLTPAAYQRAVVLSEYFPPDAALAAGFFDELQSPDRTLPTAMEHSQGFLQLDPAAHARSKRRIRSKLIRRIRISVPLDLYDAAMMGLRGAKPRSKR